MNKLEAEFNKRRIGLPIIECYIIDLCNGSGFGASLNALSISDVVRNLPDGYELDVLMTLENYFNNKKIDQYSIEIKNSQYIYYESFERIVESGFYEYIEALDKKDEVKVSRMDRMYSQNR